MQPVPIFPAEITNGKLHMQDWDRFNKYLYSLDGQVEITVRKPRVPRSLNQNNYYWAVVLQIIADSTGATTEEMHEAFKIMFLKKFIGKLMTVRSTASLSKAEMKEYIDKIIIFAATELGITIPDAATVEIK